jgi:hypothetical protein
MKRGGQTLSSCFVTDFFVFQLVSVSLKYSFVLLSGLKDAIKQAFVCFANRFNCIVYM